MAPLSWWPFLLLVLLLGIFTRVYPLAAFALMLALVSVLARWWNERSLNQVTYLRKLPYIRGFPGENLAISIEVQNKKFLPLSWLKIVDPIPTAVSPEDERYIQSTHLADQGQLVSLFSLRWFERDRRTYTLLLRNRGVYRLGPARLESGDLFGIFERSVDQDSVEYLTVYPRMIPFNALHLRADDPFGDRRARKRLYEDPNLPMGVRDYHPEDDFRRIHWPATAHTGSLQVRVFQPVSARVLVVCLNVSTLAHYWEGTYPALLEHLVGVTASLVQHAMEDGYQVGLVSNGCLAHADQSFRVLPGRSPAQLTHLLTVLAGVTPFITGPFERFLISEAPRLPYGATLVVVTGLMYPGLAETLLRLKQHGRRITLLNFARQASDPIQGINLVHLPFIG